MRDSGEASRHFSTASDVIRCNAPYKATLKSGKPVQLFPAGPDRGHPPLVMCGVTSGDVVGEPFDSFERDGELGMTRLRSLGPLLKHLRGGQHRNAKFHSDSACLLVIRQHGPPTAFRNRQTHRLAVVADASSQLDVKVRLLLALTITTS